MAERTGKFQNHKLDQPRRTSEGFAGKSYEKTNAEYAKELGITTRQASKLRNGKKPQ